ncbi:MAG: hypothetical protein SFV55_20785 [Haliscomenobacter sp.]|uniref:hypothetical protein n=1 Tax=Haliscomenobacter sp. TaxID=2717303 RepID=UPI0029B7DA46|nr:hypothetical protein [Haliscomenobacter sp.]MDX2070878.1 hypothetical protein [Haliscomenobacter sp.]
MSKFFEPTEINELLRRTTVKVTSPHEEGSGVLYKPVPESPFVYVLTARHVLLGIDGLPEDVSPNQIILKFLFNPNSNSYFEYQLQVSDLMLVSDNSQEDFAALVVPSVAIEQLTGVLPILTLIRETHGLINCRFRGFPDAYEAEVPILMEGNITESTKGSVYQFEWEVLQRLDDQWVSSESRTAYENVRGFSGSGVFFVIEDELYLLGIASNFDAFNRFFGEKVAFLEYLIKGIDQLPNPDFCIPEVRPEVRTAIKKLDANAKTEVLNRIKATIGETHCLPREQLINDLTKAIETNPVVIVHGDAGAGKSAAVKNCLVDGKQRFFAIKGEQICAESFHTTLKSITGTDVDLKTLLTSPLLKEPVVIWVDGAEKSIERNQTNALIDLIRMTVDFPALRVVITIRKYALEHFRLLVLNATRRFHVYEVPLLSLEEQELIGQQFPAARSFLDNPKLRRLLRVPFYLNYAVLLNEPTEAGKELDEFTFREEIWRLAIAGRTRNLDRTLVFTDLVVKRATQMALYVRVDKADFEVVEQLEREHILVREKDTNRFAPAHDIFEDWALVRHVRSTFQDHGLPADLFQHLGSAYAIRRGFRFWLQEEVKHQPSEILRFATQCIMGAIDQYWKDETFIVLVQSEEGARFLNENHTLLLNNNARLLLRFIHLFRVASKEPDASLPGLREIWKLYSSTFIPVGHGWATLIHFLHQHLGVVNNNEALYLFLKDWSCKLVWNKPLPSEARDAGLILLTVFQRMRSGHLELLNSPQNEIRKDTLRLIFRLTEVLQEEVKTLLEETLDEIIRAHTHRDGLGKGFGLIWEQMLSFFHCVELCRYFPGLIMEAAWMKWVDDKPSITQSYSWTSTDVNRSFGLASEHHLDDFPESAWQTPTLWLLRYHPTETLNWIIRFFNYVTQKYEDSEYSSNDDCTEIELVLNDGKTIIQRGNLVLYLMFRGTGKVTPYLLQSTLMALEKWLLELAEIKTDWSRKLLQESFELLLKDSQTVATTSVLVSVAIAYPEEIGEPIYPLLTSPEIYQWDTNRMNQEFEAEALASMGTGMYDSFYQKERVEANRMPHRKTRLEEFVVERAFNNLDFRNRFFPILDRFWEEVPPGSSTWRIFLNRMDIRKWETTKIEEFEGKYRMMVQPKIEDDIRLIVDQARQELTETSLIIAANLWAKNIFDQKEGYSFSIDEWLIHYNYVRNFDLSNHAGYIKTKFPAALLASVAIRDGINDLSVEQIEWCERQILDRAKLELEDSKRPYTDLRFSKNLFEGVPALCSLVPLLRKRHSQAIRQLVIELLFEALLQTELSDNLKSKFFDYVGDNLWAIDQQVAYACWAGLINYAALWRKYPGYGYYIRPHDRATRKEFKNFEKEKVRLIQSVVNLNIKSEPLPDFLDVRSRWWFDKALRILPANIPIEECREFVGQFLSLLLRIGNRKSGDGDRPSDFYMSYLLFSEYFAKFIFAQPKELVLPLFDQLTQTILQAKSYNRRIFEFVQKCLDQITTTIAQNPDLDTQIFGFYWKRLLHASIASSNKYFTATLLLESPYWHDHVSDWKPIRDNKALFIEIIQKMGEHASDSVVRLLAGIGSDILLPDGLLWLHEILQKRGIEQVKIHDMERLLNRVWVFHAPGIRKNRDLLQSLMAILDLMVEKGSSLAFFMRESLFGG